MEEIVNKVAQSGIVTIDLEEFYDETPRVVFDIKPWLFQELILKEKDLQPFAKKTIFGNLEILETILFQEKINALDLTLYKDARIVIKGCGDKPVPIAAYVALTEKIKPVAKSIMYGEPCSTVPLYKQPAQH